MAVECFEKTIHVKSMSSRPSVHLRFETILLNLVQKPLNNPEVEGLDRLKDLPRPGAPDKFTPEQVCQLIALACENPETYDRPITHWTARELADKRRKPVKFGKVS